MKMAPAWRIFGTQASASCIDNSRCSGAMRLAMAQACSMSKRTWISAPRPESEASITARRGMVGSSFDGSGDTVDVAPSGQTRIGLRQFIVLGLRKEVHRHPVGVGRAIADDENLEGPATMSMPTTPKTRRLAAAT